MDNKTECPFYKTECPVRDCKIKDTPEQCEYFNEYKKGEYQNHKGDPEDFEGRSPQQ
jgi:hypothetical protein